MPSSLVPHGNWSSPASKIQLPHMYWFGKVAILEGCDLRRNNRIYILVQTCKAECTESYLLFHIYFRNGKQNTWPYEVYIASAYRLLHSQLEKPCHFKLQCLTFHPKINTEGIYLRRLVLCGALVHPSNSSCNISCRFWGVNFRVVTLLSSMYFV